MKTEKKLIYVNEMNWRMIKVYSAMNGIKMQEYVDEILTKHFTKIEKGQ